MIDPTLEKYIRENGNRRRMWFYGLAVDIKAWFRRLFR